MERDYSDKDLRAALGSSPPLEKMKMGHTPTPWDYWHEPFEGTYRIRRIIQGGENRIIIGHVVREENAQLIVKAVNSHTSNLDLITELVGALEGLRNRSAQFINHTSHVDVPDHVGQLFDQAFDRADAVLARAKASHGAGT